MKARATQLTITISIEEGKELQNQILRHLGGNMKLHTELSGTPLGDLFELLNRNFDSAVKGVNYT